MGKILVVDDDVVAQRLVERILVKDGHTVFTEANGQDALARLQLEPDIHVLVTDIRMPKMDGRDLALAIRAWPERRHLPIILMSGAVGPKFIADVLKDGVSAFVAKPVDATQLLEYVNRYLEWTPHGSIASLTDRDSD